MKRPKAVVLGKHSPRKQLETILREHPLGFKVESYPTYAAWRIAVNGNGNGHPPSIVYIDHYEAHKGSPDLRNGFDIAKKVKDRYPTATNVILLRNEDESARSKVESDPNITPLVRARLPLYPGKRKVGESIDSLIANGDVVVRPKIGIIGLGKLGGGLQTDLREASWVDQIFAYSNLKNLRRFINENYPRLAEQLANEHGFEWDFQVLKALNEEPDTGKTSYLQTPQDVIDKRPDILIVATGYHVDPKDLENYPGRQEMFDNSLGTVERIQRMIRDSNFQNLTFFETNPPSPFLYIGKNKYGLPPNKISSISADTNRNQYALRSLLYKAISARSDDFREMVEDLEPFQIHLPVVGEHGEEFPLIDKCTVRGVPLRDLDPDFYRADSEFFEELVESARPVGKQAMIAAGLTGRDYRGTPRAIAHELYALSHLQQPRSCLTCYMDDGSVLDGHYLQTESSYHYNVTGDSMDVSVHEKSPIPLDSLGKYSIEIETGNDKERVAVPNIIIRQIVNQVRSLEKSLSERNSPQFA